MLTLLLRTSIAHCTGRLDTGTLASTVYIRIVISSTSDVLTSMLHIVVDMPGTCMVHMATTTATEVTSVLLTESTLECMIAGIVVTSAIHATVQHV